MAYTNFDILQTKNDKREIKGLKLDNNITAVLISDNTLSKSSCCVGVHTGYSDDYFCGTAHFLEHLLFLGNTKNPDKNDFHTFIQNSGGYDNAYTSQTSTCYFININTNKMKEAIEKLVCFFKEPLLDEKYIASEKNIINSEHNKNINSDDWIMTSLFKKFMKKSNYKNFGTGNNSSLKGITRDYIKQFFDKYYRSDNIFVCIVDSKSLQDMIYQYLPIFNTIPSTKLENKAFDDYFCLKDKNLIIYNSISNHNILNIFLVFNCDEKDYDNSQITRYLISKIIKSKYEKSLAYYLLEENLCFDINCSIDENYDKQMVINICITPLTNNTNDIFMIIECVNSFIHYLQNIPEIDFQKFYNNYRNIKLLKAKYSKKPNVEDLVLDTVENLMRYDNNFCINKKYFFIPYSNEIFNKYKNIINSCELKIITNIKIKDTNKNKIKKDKYYKVDYFLTNIKIKKDKYDFALSNFIIFNDMSIFIGGNNTNKINIMNISDNQKLYYTQNIFNNDFSGFTIIRKNNNLLNNELLLMLNVYISLIYQRFKYFLDPLNDFDMKFGVSITNNFVSFNFYGFNILLENYILHIFKNFQKNEILQPNIINKIKKYFDNIIKLYIKNLENDKFDMPYNLSLNKIEDIVLNNMPNIDKINFLKNLTFEKLIANYEKIFCFEKETFISIGNLNNQDVINKLSQYNNICNTYEVIVNPITKFNFIFPENEIIDTEQNNCICFCNIVNNIILVHNNEKIIIKEQYENDIVKNRLIYSLLSTIVNEIIFDKLRTEKKLGYIVKCLFINYQTNNNNIMIINYLIQSSKDIEYIRKCVEEFNIHLKELILRGSIKNKFDSIKDTKLKEYEKKRFTSITNQIAFYKNNIIYGSDNFNYTEIELKILTNLKYADIINHLNNITNNDKSMIIYKSKIC